MTSTSKGMRENVRSKNLSVNVHDGIFALLGPECFVCAIGLGFLHRDEKDWPQIGGGAVCYVRDYEHKTVTLRLFDIEKGPPEEMWSNPILEKATFERSTANFVIYKEETGFRVGINFSEEREATVFLASVELLQQKRRQLANDRDRSSPSSSPSDPPSPRRLPGTFKLPEVGSAEVLRKNPPSTYVPSDPSPAGMFVARPQFSLQDEQAQHALAARSFLLPQRSAGELSRKVKVHHEGVVRQFTFTWSDHSSAHTYEQFLAGVRSVVPNFKGDLAWRDSEGEMITFSSDGELREALRDGNQHSPLVVFATASSKKPPRFEQFVKNKVLPKIIKKTPPPPPSKPVISNPMNMKHLVHMGTNPLPGTDALRNDQVNQHKSARATRMRPSSLEVPKPMPVEERRSTVPIPTPPSTDRPHQPVVSAGKFRPTLPSKSFSQQRFRSVPGAEDAAERQVDLINEFRAMRLKP